MIRAKIDAGALPTKIAGKMYAGFGTELACDGCETPILPAQVEHEFEAPDGRTVRFHVGCAGLWEAALRRLGVNPRSA
jgi:hypothetical protein